MAGHTPGPWATHEYDRTDSQIMVRSNARHWAVACAHEMKGCTDPTADISAAEADANARLIAAAPDLYQAAMEAASVARFEQDMPSEMRDVAFAKIEKVLRAAIAKATGEAP